MEQFTLKELVKRKLDETYIIIYAILHELLGMHLTCMKEKLRRLFLMLK